MSNASKRFSSQAVIGSTKLPVVKSQYRVAPTPAPSMRAPTGDATPTRNNHSRAGGSGGNATTCRHTTAGGASISTGVTTSRGSAVARGSASTRSGANRAAMPVRDGGSTPHSAIARPNTPPQTPTNATSGNASARQNAPSAAKKSIAAIASPRASSTTS